MGKKAADFKVTGLKELCDQLDQMAVNAYPILKGTLFVGARVLFDAIKKNLDPHYKPSKVTRSGSFEENSKEYKRKYEIDRTGELVRSMGLSKMRVNGTTVDIVIGFAGTDAKGVPNAIKAAALESGTYHVDKGSAEWQKPTPFIRPAVKSCKRIADGEMQEEFLNQISHYVEVSKK